MAFRARGRLPLPSRPSLLNSILSFVGGLGGAEADSSTGPAHLKPIPTPKPSAPQLEMLPARNGSQPPSGAPSSRRPSTRRDDSVASRLAHARQQRSLERASCVKPQLVIGGDETCAACGKKAYFAERRTVGNKVYHNQCFCCTICRKKLTHDYGFTANELGVDTLYCLPHANQMRVNNGTAGKL